MNSTIERIRTILDARPQLTKAEILSSAIATVNELKDAVVHASQNFDANISYVFLAGFGKDLTTMSKAIPKIELCSACWKI